MFSIIGMRRRAMDVATTTVAARTTIGPAAGTAITAMTIVVQAIAATVTASGIRARLSVSSFARFRRPNNDQGDPRVAFLNPISCPLRCLMALRLDWQFQNLGSFDDVSKPSRHHTGCAFNAPDREVRAATGLGCHDPHDRDRSPCWRRQGRPGWTA